MSIESARDTDCLASAALRQLAETSLEDSIYGPTGELKGERGMALPDAKAERCLHCRIAIDAHINGRCP